MSEKLNNSGPEVYEGVADPKAKAKTNGTKRYTASANMPDINVRELIEERNWPALGGLALIAIGILYVFQSILGFDFNLWSFALLGMGGWLAYDGYQQYENAGRTWVGSSRNRVMGGGAIAIVGLLSILNLSSWTLFLMAVGGWLIYDARRHYERNGQVWTDRARNRMVVGAILGLIGLFGLVNVWITWPLLLIAIGAVMLFRYIGKN